QINFGIIIRTRQNVFLRKRSLDSSSDELARFSVLNTCSGIPSLPPAPTSAAFEAIDSSVTKTVPLASGCPNEGIACAQPSRSQISHSGAADHSNNPNVVSC